MAPTQQLAHGNTGPSESITWRSGSDLVGPSGYTAQDRANVPFMMEHMNLEQTSEEEEDGLSQGQKASQRRR